MKKVKIISKTGLMCLWVLLLVYQTSYAQSPYTGIWEGNFMEQFKTVLLLDQVEGSEYAGKIIMFSGENRIQDDELSKISIENSELSFYIASKESSFKGTFNETNTELSGNFIFPDNSRHPLSVRKFEKDSAVVEATTPSVKERLKLSFPAEELKSEFRNLIQKLKKYHPRLYSYTSEVSFENQVKEILSNLNSDLDIEEYYLRIAPLVASVECSHTGIRLPGEYQQSIYKNGLFFPLNIHVHESRIYCLSTHGSEIVSINDRPVSQIIDELLSIIPSEGNCMSTKYHVLNQKFHIYFHMLDPSDRFHIEYSPSTSMGSVQLDACNYEQLELNDAAPLSLVPYSFHRKSNPELGILEVSSFGIRNMEEFFAFLDSAFRIMKDSSLPNLLLDLRNNQGGHPIFAAQLFSYLTNRDFIYFKTNPDVEEFEPLYHEMKPNPLHYTGNIYVLVNGACLSTTGHLISLLKYHTEALFVGEEPGSSFLCNDKSILLQLSNTGMEVNIPQTTFLTAVSGFNEDGPFPVDYEVNISVQDLLDGTDTYHSKVIELLNEKQALNE